MMDDGVLSSLRYYDAERRSASDVTRFEGSNVDHFTTSNGEDISLCHLSSVLPFTFGDYKPQLNVAQDMASIALAAHHLNVGDGSIVKEVEGLNERCDVRFTTEFADTEFSAGAALNHVVTQSNREPNSSERLPCAFIGAWKSSISIPMSIVTGLFGYPQVSGASTSVDLDDASQFPLFGRTVPSDQGNAEPVIIYMSNVLKIKHLTVINVNDAYGNAYVEGLRLASQKYAPDMVIHQIPLDEGQSSIEDAIASVKKVKHRFIFGIVFTAETHDALLIEAVKQEVAGDGLHNWLFADSFPGELDRRVFPEDSPLHKAYQGVSSLEASGGVPGMESYENYVSKFPQLNNPIDLAYMSSLIPSHDHPNYPDEIPFLANGAFLQPPFASFAPFSYEATISLGLAACAASEQSKSFTGQEHFDKMLEVEATGVAGTIKFDGTTGTRLPSTVLYKVSNWVEEPVGFDSQTGQQGYTFKPVVTDLFQNGEWVQQTDYIFNDGTSILPADLPPTMEEDPNLAFLVGLPVCLAFLFLLAMNLCLQYRKNKEDYVWKVKKEELNFAKPPVVIGRGTFGLVLKAEYRGTEVAVKRVIPQGQGSQKGSDDGTRSTSNLSLDTGDMNDGMQSQHKSGQANFASWGGGYNSGFARGIINMYKGSKDSSKPSSAGSKGRMSNALKDMFGNSPKQTDAPNRKKLREEFISEMKYLSKLRHPCVTTMMGAVIGKGEEPMLVMEYMHHGSLYDLLHNEIMVIEGEMLLPLLRDVSQGMRFLHSADPQVLHGDLKAANILVDSRFRAKVADFGLSQNKNLGGTGTPYWMAPELLRQESPNTSQTDVFSFGIILYEVYSRSEPYKGEDPHEVLPLVADKNIRKRPPMPWNMPNKTKSLMSDCLEEEPQKRPSFEELDLRLQRIDVDAADIGLGSSIKRSNVSLFDIFPRHVAEALRDGRTVQPEHKDCVTVFFSDVVGFTNIAAELDPRKVASLLDRLYTSFDELSQKHGIFKVETIGDAYMAVTNLVEDQEGDHAKRIALFAIDAVAAAKSTLIDEDDPGKGFVNIRVGFHSGPIVADVVGKRNPRYCLFGDTVNTASRMESSSKANHIHCSKATAKLLHKQCKEVELKSRGKIHIKGKGKMQTFWVYSQFDDEPDMEESESEVMHHERLGSPGGLSTIADTADESISSNNNSSSVALSSGNSVRKWFAKKDSVSHKSNGAVMESSEADEENTKSPEEIEVVMRAESAKKPENCILFDKEEAANYKKIVAMRLAKKREARNYKSPV